MKKILLICHNFPPYPGIGGRRWAKFAKYLALKGFEIHVIASENPLEEISSWHNDIINKNIIVHRLPIKYPSAFINSSDSLVSKLKFRLLKAYYEFIQKKRIFDKAFLWQNQLINKAEEIIKKHSIENIIVTGAPFYLLYYTSCLKKDHPQLHIISDYRDPWIGAVNYGMQQLKGKKLKLELEMQKEVFYNSNYITAPNSFLLRKIQQSLGIENSEKFFELPHGYDYEDIKPFLEERTNLPINKLKFLYAGTLYIDTENYINQLVNFLDDVKENDLVLYEQLAFEFYTPEVHLNELFKKHADKVVFEKPIGTRIFEKLAKADFCLLFLAEHNKDYCTTKFFEFLPFKKPYILFGQKGFVSDFIISNNLGFYFSQNTNCSRFMELLKLKDSQQKILNIENDYFENYSIENITEKLITILK